MKKYLFLFLILLLFPFYSVSATSVSKIDMDIFIDDNGNANVVEVWNADVTNGTEGYHPYFNYGESYFSDLSVSMDGKEFETINNWDINNSFSDKKYKAGFYKTGDELDICFGISEYGSHVYTIKYTINKFVVRLSDADMVYWNLFPKNFSANPDNVYIKIHSNFKYNKDLNVWGYGKYGAPCYVYDGIIEMTSDDKKVNSDEYMTILIKFDKDTFNTNYKLDNEFNYYYNMAQEGAVNYKDSSNSLISKILNILGVVLYMSIFLLPFIIAIIFGVKSGNKGKCRFGKAGNKVRKDVPNFREIPCNKDIFRAYWVAYNYNLGKKKEDFLGSVLLKWIRFGNVRIENVTKKGLFKDKTDANIIFDHEPTDANNYESTLYSWMVQASKDNKLEKGEFKKWCSIHYNKILGWFDDVIDYESKLLVNENKAKLVTSGKVFKSTYYEIDDSMMIEAEQLAGLKKFLKEFTLIKERQPIEVNLWDEYLMFAQIFGIANEVASQFKKLYPEIIDDMNNSGFDYDDIVFVHMISRDSINSASSARSRAESYSSGGGGFSSGGGGGGSFGGGGGGGGFR